MFGRRKRKNDEPELETFEDATEQDGEQDTLEPVPAGPPSRPQGPWDLEDAPETEQQRLDLGALQVPVPPNTEVRVDVNAEGAVVAATLVQGEGQVQINVFAAPRSEGIWDEVRAEIAEALVQSGGKAEDRPGAFGTELHALVPTEVPGRGVVLAPARFLGVDGPRWFLRALFTGAAATEAEVGRPLEAALRDVVVVRGTDPMAVRDPLPLVLPAAAVEAAAQQQAEAEGAAAQAAEESALQMPERGPEITETR